MYKKTRYTRQERINYYRFKKDQLLRELAYIDKRLEYLESDKFQDWDSELSKDLDKKQNKVGS